MAWKGRKFGGKQYEFAGTVKEEATAYDVARKMRHSGYSVRVIKQRTRWGNYILYRRKK